MKSDIQDSWWLKNSDEIITISKDVISNDEKGNKAFLFDSTYSPEESISSMNDYSLISVLTVNFDIAYCILRNLATVTLLSNVK